MRDVAIKPGQVAAITVAIKPGQVAAITVMDCDIWHCSSALYAALDVSIVELANRCGWQRRKRWLRRPVWYCEVHADA